ARELTARARAGRRMSRDRDQARRLDADAAHGGQRERRETEDGAEGEAPALAGAALELDLSGGEEDDRVLPRRCLETERPARRQLDDPGSEQLRRGRREPARIELGVVVHRGGAIANRSTNPGCTKTAIAAISPAATRGTVIPHGRNGAPASGWTNTASAGCRFARVGTWTCIGADGANGFSARKRAIASRPAYHEGEGGIVSFASSLRSFTSASRSVRVHASMYRARTSCSSRSGGCD